jgi:hypothetical protein
LRPQAVVEGLENLQQLAVEDAVQALEAAAFGLEQQVGVVEGLAVYQGVQ